MGSTFGCMLARNASPGCNALLHTLNHCSDIVRPLWLGIRQSPMLPTTAPTYPYNVRLLRSLVCHLLNIFCEGKIFIYKFARVVRRKS